VTRSEIALLALLRKEGQVQTNDEDAIRGLELRGLAERCGGGVVRYVAPRQVDLPPAKRLEALKEALREEPLSQKEAIEIMGEYRYLWLALQDGGVVRLLSGDYAIPGGPVTRHLRHTVAERVRRVLPVGCVMMLHEIIKRTELRPGVVRNALTEMCRSGEVTRVSKGEYTR
jgi:hypothetical protein